MTKEKQCVYIVDDDDAVRESLSRTLSLRGYETRVFASADAFLAEHLADNHGCLVVDYKMPGKSGLDLQAELSQMNKAVPTIFISAHGGIPESVQAVKSGALDFLEKPFNNKELTARIDEAFALNVKLSSVDQKAYRFQERFNSLTKREKEIVRLWLAHSSQTTSKDVARQLGISPRTVDHHRFRILEKLQVASVTELVGLMVTFEL